MRTLFVAYLFVSAALLLCAQTAHAWWCFGHMATTQVAKSQMTPATIAYVEYVIQNLATMGPFDNIPDMNQVACWADDLKDPIMLKMMGDWHFIDQVYTTDGYVVPPGGDHIENKNIAKVIKQFYTGITTNKQSPSGWAMGFAVANLIHFIGDLHQPLHATELFNYEYPEGDMGGNKEVVIVNGETRNLHMIWDSICWKWSGDLQRPLNAADDAKLKDYSEYLLKTYSFTDKQISVYDPMVMAAESFELAASTVYPGIVSGAEVSQEYLAKCLPVAEARVALGGLRLGKQLQYLVGEFAEEWYKEMQHAEKQARHPSALKKRKLAQNKKQLFHKRLHAEKKEDSAASAAVEKEEPIVVDMPAHKVGALLNKTAISMAYMRKQFANGLEERAQKLKVAHLKRKAI